MAPPAGTKLATLTGWGTIPPHSPPPSGAHCGTIPPSKVLSSAAANTRQRDIKHATMSQASQTRPLFSGNNLTLLSMMDAGNFSISPGKQEERAVFGRSGPCGRDRLSGADVGGAR